MRENRSVPRDRRGTVPLILLIACALPTLPVQQQSIPSSTVRSVQERIARYERPDREEWQKPEEVLRALQVREGMVIADIGAGSGYFSRRFARAVGPLGKVYAVDIDREILAHLQQEARRQGLANLHIILSREDDPLLPEQSIDLAFFCDTTHHVADRVKYYRRLSRALKDGGRLAIIDFPPEAHERGHCPHRPEELVPPAQVIAEAEQAGFELIQEFSFLPRQYFLVFRKRPVGRSTSGG